jgi:hypothetical protein
MAIEYAHTAKSLHAQLPADLSSVHQLACMRTVASTAWYNMAASDTTRLETVRGSSERFVAIAGRAPQESFIGDFYKGLFKDPLIVSTGCALQGTGST